MLCPYRAPVVLRPYCVVTLRSRFQSDTVGARHGHGTACVNQARLHCANEMRTTQSKSLPTRHARGTAWAQHGMCELAFKEPKTPISLFSVISQG